MGAGDGRLVRQLSSRDADVVAFDRSAPMLAAAGSVDGAGLMRVRGDATALPFADASFDVTVAATVLCFADSADQLVGELVRVTRPNGRVVVGELGRWSIWAMELVE